MAYAWQLLNIYSKVKRLLWSTEDVIIDSMAMRMNYKVTTSFLLLSSSLVTFHKWFGGSKPIECISNFESPPSFLDDYCWIHPKNISVTEEAWSEDKFEKRFEGLYGDSGFSSYYYEWTSFFFLFQAVSFFMTRFIWVRWENGTMRYFKRTLDSDTIEDDKKACIASEMILERSIKGFNRAYSFGYCFCEFLCLLNICLQFIITNRFLGTIKTDWIGTVNFINLGESLWANNSRPWLPLRMMFPRQSKCRIQVTGSGGGTDTINAICLLSLNIIHEKVKGNQEVSRPLFTK